MLSYSSRHSGTSAGAIHGCGTSQARLRPLLQRRGLTKGDQVILWGPNSPHWVLIFFGCIRAGVILVPLDLRSAPDYVAKVVSRTDPKLAFTSRSTPKGEVDLGSPEITFEELEAAIQGFAPARAG